ncbi:MAG TPA: hypothetical protein VGP76_29965 [Planctomycetaceae bacterium]|jgi:hypothetical protein|nr:hypothetical protein [Planctomycetaceae bacterium]
MSRNRSLFIAAFLACGWAAITAWAHGLQDENRRILFEEPLILTVAILSALSVVAILMIPCYRLVRTPQARVASAVGASLLAIAAVIVGDLAFTRWALYNNGRPATLDQWIGFAIVNAIIGAVAALPGGWMGFVVGRALDNALPADRVRPIGYEARPGSEARE